MKQRLLICILLLTGFSASAQGPWALKDSITGPGRYGASAFSVGGYGYVVAGYHATAILDDCWEYDAGNDTWSQKANFPGGMRWNGCGFAIGNYGYVSCGFSSVQNYTMFHDLWRYDPASNSWSSRAMLPAAGRWHATAFAVNGKGYLGTGQTTTTMQQDFWEYDPATDTWTQKQNTPVPLAQASSFALGTKGYILCGNDTTTTFTYASRNAIWEYDPATDTWTQKANLPGNGRYCASTFTIANLGYITLGKGLGYPLDTWAYNPVTDTWIQKANFPAMGRWMAASFTIGGAGYITTGFRQTKIVTQETWSYDHELTAITALENDVNALHAWVSNDQLQITATSAVPTDVIFHLYDVQGRLISSSALTGISSASTCISLPLQSVSNGVYVCVMTSSTGQQLAVSRVPVFQR